MTNRTLQPGLTRRRLLGTIALGAAGSVGSTVLPKISWAADDNVVKIGFLAPLTGDVAAWGKPGLDGVQIWAERVNQAGGVKIGDDSYMVEFVPYDNEYDPGKARAGATKLIKEDGRQVRDDAGRRHLVRRSKNRRAGRHAVLDPAAERPDARTRPLCWRRPRSIRSTT